MAPESPLPADSRGTGNVSRYEKAERLHGLNMDLEFRPTQLRQAHLRSLRAATDKDLAFVADVLSGRIKFRECVHAGRTVGHCVGNSATGEILSLSVDHEYRRQGIARKLLSLVVDLLCADGVQRIWLAAPRDSTLPAYNFYRSLGWRPTGEQLASGDEILELQIVNRSDVIGLTS